MAGRRISADKASKAARTLNARGRQQRRDLSGASERLRDGDSAAGKRMSSAYWGKRRK